MNRNEKERTMRLYLRVSPQEKKKIESTAKKCGISVSEYMRQRALGFSPREIPSVEFYSVMRYLYQINEKLDKYSPKTEENLNSLIEDMRLQFLAPGKENADEIKKSVSG